MWDSHQEGEGAWGDEGVNSPKTASRSCRRRYYVSLGRHIDVGGVVVGRHRWCGLRDVEENQPVVGVNLRLQCSRRSDRQTTQRRGCAELR